jgi:hypothetical protein
VKADLKLDWCSYRAAKFATLRWHYSRSLPSSKTARIGVWENGRFIGAIVFAWGANLRLAGEFGLKMTECAELCRVALTRHLTPVSRIVAISVKMLKRAMPGIRLIVSYADPEHGHVGKIYQAMGWVYVGESKGPGAMMLKGKPTHRRTINSKYGTSSVAWLRQHVDGEVSIIRTLPKHKYLFALDAEMKTVVEKLRKSYPKRAASIGDDAPGVRSGEGGSTPTAALQSIGQFGDGGFPSYS